MWGCHASGVRRPALGYRARAARLNLAGPGFLRRRSRPSPPWELAEAGIWKLPGPLPACRPPWRGNGAAQESSPSDGFRRARSAVGEPRPALALLFGRLLERERSVPDVARPLVRRHHDAGRGRGRIGELQPRGWGAVAEDPLSGSEHDREDHEPELVYEIVLEQRLDQVGAAMHLDLRPFLLLDLRHRLGGVALEQGRVVPLDPVERPRGHVLPG